MKRTLAVLVLVLLAALATWASCPSRVKCPVDDTNAYPTGNWDRKNGHEWKEYRCTDLDPETLTGAHTFWVRCD